MVHISVISICWCPLRILAVPHLTSEGHNLQEMYWKKKVNFWEQKPAVVYLQRKKRKKRWYITLHCPELLDLTLIAVKLLELKLVIYLLAATQDLSLQAARFYHSSINSPPNVNFQNTDLTEKCGETLPMSTKNEHNCMMKTLNT